MSKSRGPFNVPVSRLAGGSTMSIVDEDFIKQGSWAQPFRESLPRFSCAANVAIAATGVAHATGISLQEGITVSNITFRIGTTGANTPTAGFIALYDPTLTLLAQSAAFGSTARAVSTTYTIPLSTQVTCQTSGFYYVAISFTATTVPTMVGITGVAAVNGNAFVSGMPSLTGTSGSALGDVAPATLTLANIAGAVYYILT
jgi:hypothetical protein